MADGNAARIRERVVLRKYDVHEDGTKTLAETLTFEYEDDRLLRHTAQHHTEEEDQSCR